MTSSCSGARPARTTRASSPTSSGSWRRIPKRSSWSITSNATSRSCSRTSASRPRRCAAASRRCSTRSGSRTCATATPRTLSGGERQRCAIAGALAASPSALVLDEPTSQLDPQGADDVLAALTRLNHDLGTTVVLAEHRLERAAPLADRAVVVADGAVGVPDRPGLTLADYPGAPSVTRLGRVLGWDPPPLTVRDARAFAARQPVELRPPDDAPRHDARSHDAVGARRARRARWPRGAARGRPRGQPG